MIANADAKLTPHSPMRTGDACLLVAA